METKARIIAVFFLTLLTVGTTYSQGQFKVLLVTKTNGWHHDAIVEGVPAMRKLAARNNFEIQRHQDGEKLSKKVLDSVDVILLMSTTGDIFDIDEQKVFEDFIRSGKGYVGIHAASDTEYDWDWYTKLVGRMFHIHPEQQTAKLNILNHDFPGLEHFPDRLLWTDEWYEFGEEKVSDLNYLITVDENTYDIEARWKEQDIDENGKKNDRVAYGMGNLHPISWYHLYDGGRSFYTALGHIPGVYQDQFFLDHVYGGIYWAATGKGIEK